MSGLTPSAGSKFICKHLMRGAPDCVFCERDVVMAENEKLRKEYDELGRAAQHDIEILQGIAKDAVTENEKLRKALSERLQQLEEARLCLQGIASCSTCEVCRGAAQIALGVKS